MMNKIFHFIIVVFTMSSLGTALFAAGEPKLAKASEDAMKNDVRDIRKIFIHDRHKDVFKSNQITCLECHKMSKDENLKTSLGTKSTNVWGALDETTIKSSCHKCHVGNTGEITLNSRCLTCHTQIQPPQDHLPNLWQQTHKLSATNNPESCLVCHQKQDCASCHQSRETIQANMHPRSFRYFHSIEAKANSKSCATCHKVNFCADCHSQGVRP